MSSEPPHHQDTQLAAKAGKFAIGNDLRIARLGFGAMGITGKGVWGPPADRQEAIRVLRRALGLGIDFIDTADSYGPAVSEELIAEALHPYPENLVIATKGGYDRPGPDRWVENGRPEHLVSACEGSLRRLKLDRIDLYQLHRIDSKVPADDQLGTLRKLQQQGKIKHTVSPKSPFARLYIASNTEWVSSLGSRSMPDASRAQVVRSSESPEKWAQLLRKWR